MLPVRMNLAVVFFFTFFVFSIQDPQLRSLLSSDALSPSKSAFIIFSKSNSTSKANKGTSTADAADDETTQKSSEEESQVADHTKTGTNPITSESKSMMRSDGEISLTTVLLKDIRDALYEKTENLEQEFKENVKHRLNSLSLEVQESVSAVTADLERVRESMEQKVELMLETFSTLRLLVVGQGQHLDELQERLQGMEEEVEQLKQTKAAMQQRSSSNYKTQDEINNPGSLVRGKRNPETENGDMDLNKAVRNTTKKLEDLKQKVQNVTEEVFAVKDELQNLQTNVTSLSLASSTPIPLKTSMTVTPSSMSCQCSTEVLQNAIEKLEAAQKKQKNDFVEMKRRISVVESFRSGVGSYSQRLGVAEGPREDLEEVKTTVAAVQDDLNKLKEGMEGAVTSNGTFFAKASGEGMCVWPYTRGGGSCYFVNREDRLGWEAAREHCRGLQGDLASPANIQTFRSFVHMQRLSRAYTYWMGASNTNPERAWKWTDGRGVGEDIIETGMVQTSRAPKCLAIKPSFRFGGLAESCHESKFFICQQERLL
ncbi:oxidized low-density lipoprotein receptor 1-like [Portunus trituberculatus]|nr:oxidized low-density lipoprotein receptor 1-like [Portunus trituberculatus]